MGMLKDIDKQQRKKLIFIEQLQYARAFETNLLPISNLHNKYYNVFQFILKQAQQSYTIVPKSHVEYTADQEELILKYFTSFFVVFFSFFSYIIHYISRLEKLPPNVPTNNFILIIIFFSHLKLILRILRAGERVLWWIFQLLLNFMSSILLFRIEREQWISYGI